MQRARATKRNPAYWPRLLCFGAVSLGIMLLMALLLFGFLNMWQLTHAPCTAGGGSPADYGYDYEDISIQAREGDGTHRGYYIPSQNGANIIFPPAFSNGRDGALHEADVLARHGYGVLTYESRSCIGQINTLGYREVDDLAAALDWLLARPDVDPERIGVQGFSSAGASATLGAARLPALRAVVAEGGYHDLRAIAVGSHNNRVEILVHLGAQLGYRLTTGVNIGNVSPVSVIHQIAPRPILLIYGSEEVSLPGARQQLAAAGEGAQLWVVEGAGHGGYLYTAPEEYERRVVDFFDAALPGDE